MFRRKAAHHDMADVNVYTAKRLNDMANSLGNLPERAQMSCPQNRDLQRKMG